MQNLTYPKMTDENRALTGIITIDSGTDYDTIYLGSTENILLGFINQDADLFTFVPASSMNKPFPTRSAYATCLADVFTLIANDLDLAIEFTILVNRKVNKEDK